MRKNEIGAICFQRTAAHRRARRTTLHTETAKSRLAARGVGRHMRRARTYGILKVTHCWLAGCMHAWGRTSRYHGITVTKPDALDPGCVVGKVGM